MALYNPYGIDPTQIQLPSSRSFTFGSLMGGPGPFIGGVPGISGYGGNTAISYQSGSAPMVRNIGAQAPGGYGKTTPSTGPFGAYPGDPNAESNNYLNTIRQNMAFSADPQARITAAQQGNYYLDSSIVGADTANLERYNRLQMALSANPQTRIPSAPMTAQPSSGSSNLTDVLSALAKSLQSVNAGTSQTITPTITVSSNSASQTSTTNPNIGLK